MRRLILFFVLAIFTVSLYSQKGTGIEKNPETSFRIIPRFGFSAITGIAGLELRYNQFSISGGYGGQISSMGYAAPMETHTVFNIGGTYYFSDENTWYFSGSVGFNSAYSEQGTFMGGTVNWSNAYSIVGGGRFSLFKFLDIRLGIGVSASETSMLGFAADGAVGINILRFFR